MFIAVVADVHSLLRWLDFFGNPLHQGDATEAGAQQHFPEQLSRYSEGLHVGREAAFPPSLSKLRKLKHLSLMLCQPSIVFPSIHISLKNAKTVDYDIGTLALAFCYFERLALYGVGESGCVDRQHVNKGYRKIVCADCLFIAYKFNQLCEVSSVESRRGCGA